MHSIQKMILKPTGKNYKKDSFHAISPEQTSKNAIMKLKRFGRGAFYGLRDISHLNSMGIPIYKVFGLRRRNEWGKGLTVEQAQASALMERVERISAVAAFRGKLSSKKSTFNNLTEPAISRSSFGLPNVHRAIYPGTLIDDIEMDWVKTQPLSAKEEYLVPAQMVYLSHDYRHFKDYTDSNGLASGNTMEEAIMQALCEVMERHILHKFYYNMPKIRRIDLDTVENEHLRKALSNLKERGFEVIANDFSDGWKLSTVSCFIFNPREETIFNNYLRVGTSTDPEIALIRALTEFAQSRSIFSYTGHERRDPRGFFHGASKSVLDRYKWLTEDKNMISIKEITNISSDDFKEEIEAALSDISGKGYEVLSYDLTHPKLDIPVVRVLIPGLQPNFIIRGLSYLDNGACVTEHLSVYNEVVERFSNRKLANQNLDQISEKEGSPNEAEDSFFSNLHNQTEKFKDSQPNKNTIPPIFKKYNAKKIQLPKNFEKSSVTVEDAIRERSSWRDFSGNIGINDVSKVLYYANGFRELADTDLGILQKTNAPSAGSRHPIEIYVILQRIDGVNDGIYHYDNENHLLEELSGSLPEELAGIYNHQINLTKANMLIFMTAIHRRTSWKYGPRAYRFMHLDAGHIGQNIYLIAESMGLGCCAVGGWNEESAKTMLKIDGQRELLVYSVVVGKKASPSMHKNFI